MSGCCTIFLTSNGRHIIETQRRELALLKNKKLTEEQRTKWLKVMKTEMMSSEESEVDENGD